MKTNANTFNFFFDPINPNPSREYQIRDMKTSALLGLIMALDVIDAKKIAKSKGFRSFYIQG